MNNGNGNQVPPIENLHVTEFFESVNNPKLPEVARNGEPDRLENIIRLLLQELGLDIDDQHLRETPKRVARFYREFTQGRVVKPAAILKTFNSKSADLVAVSIP